MSKKGVIVFDLDGTLINSAPDLCYALNQTLTEINIPKITLEEVKGFLGDGALELIRRGISKHTDLNNYNLEELRKRFLEIYDTCLLNETKFFPSALDSIEKIKNSNYSIAICTNKPAKLAIRIIDGLRASSLFDVITGGDSYNYRKPDPRHLLNTIKLTNNISSKAIMIGDSKNDIECAKRANVKNMIVNFGYSNIPVEELHADIIISNYNNLITHINNLINNPK